MCIRDRQCGSSCAISGTGFMVDSQIIEKNQGWKHHLLTEDIEFSVDNIIQDVYKRQVFMATITYL